MLTSEPGALANAPVLLDLAAPFAAARFVVENQVEGPVDPAALKALGKGINLSRLERLSLDAHANELLQQGGLRFIGEDLAAAEDNLAAQFGFAEAGRIVEDLTAFRARAMQAAARRRHGWRAEPVARPPATVQDRVRDAQEAERAAARRVREASRTRLTELLRLAPHERMAHLDDSALTGPDRVGLRRSIQATLAKPRRRWWLQSRLLARGRRLGIALLRGALHPAVLIPW